MIGRLLRSECDLTRCGDVYRNDVRLYTPTVHFGGLHRISSRVMIIKKAVSNGLEFGATARSRAISEEMLRRAGT